MYHSSKLTIEYIVIIRTVIYKKEYNNITVNSIWGYNTSNPPRNIDLFLIINRSKYAGKYSLSGDVATRELFFLFLQKFR